MPLILDVTEDDIKRTQVLDPGTYKLTVADVSKKANNAGTGFNIVVELDGADDATSGLKFYKYFPLKSKKGDSLVGFIHPFMRACGGEITPGAQMDMEGCKGKTVLAAIKPTLYNDKLMNSVEDFFPPA